MKKNVILLAFLSSACLPAFATENKDTIQAGLMSSQFYKEPCYIEPDDITTDLDISQCEKYIFINQSKAKQQVRSTITTQLLNIGVMSPYVLVSNPNVESERVITTLDTYEEDIIIGLINSVGSDWVSNPTQLSTVDSFPRTESLVSDAGGTSSDSSNTQSGYSWKFNQVVKLNKDFSPTENDFANLKYEVEVIASQPTDDQNSDNTKYVRVTLVGGSGINFNPTQGAEYRTIETSYPAHQLLKYSYREYLDKVKISTSWNDSKAELYDSFPRNNDQDRAGFAYNSKISFNLGVSIPKVPIKSIGFESSKSMTFQNGNYFDYYANSARNAHSVEYKNKEYGSENHRYYGLVNNSRNSWDYSKGIEAPLKTFGNLTSTPYSNGFLPKYSVTYSANKSASGQSVLTVLTDIRGISLQGYSKWAIGNSYWAGVNSSNNYGADYIPKGYKLSLKLNINWNSPIFTGIEPSVITYPYLSDNTAHCFTVNSNHDVTAEPCDSSNTDQLFVYTPEKKYMYVNNKALCLDSSQAQLKVAQCKTYGNNNQKWMWYTAPLNSHDDNTLLYTTKSSGDFKVLKGGRVNEIISVEETDALDSAFQSWPKAKLNSQNGQYTSAITVQ